MPIDLLTETQRTAHDVLVTASSMPTDLETPCSEWTLGELIDHLVDAQPFFVQLATGRAPTSPLPDGDAAGRFDRGASLVLATVAEEGFGVRVLDLPFGQFTGEQFIDFVSLETLTHTWDIAIATSQGTDLAPAAAVHLLEVATKMMGGSSRGSSSAFADPTTALPSATASDHLAAYLGRTIP